MTEDDPHEQIRELQAEVAALDERLRYVAQAATQVRYSITHLLWEEDEGMDRSLRGALDRLDKLLARPKRKAKKTPPTHTPGQIDMIDLLNQPSTPEEPR